MLVCVLVVFVSYVSIFFSIMWLIFDGKNKEIFVVVNNDGGDVLI